jgi:uncharacterized protein YjeT (DUF2065 family)
MKQPPSDRPNESTTAKSQVTRPRAVGVILLLSGVAHVLAPSTLLNLAERGYRSVLRVEFDPLPEAVNRVRLLGFGLIAAGAHLLYHDGIRTETE